MVPSGRFLIRGGEPGDLPGLLRLARHLDSYNLPAEPRRLRRLLTDSVRSFAGRERDPARRRYLFVLEDLGRRRLAGCSLIVGKHGTPGLPHLYMTSFVERRASRTLGRSVEHKCLRLGFTEDGPTEVGGLVLLPSYRGRPEGLGRWLSYVRFLYMASWPERFQNYVLVEFLPAFLKGGRSPFWDYFGRKFTGLSYREADRLSIDNKEFILSLFPPGTIYQDFFPKEIVRSLGRVGEPSLPAARLLERIGFRYLHQIEPFDGGPYYGALTRCVTPIRQARQALCRLSPMEGARPQLLLSEGGGRIRAAAAPASVRGAEAGLSQETARLLGLRCGDWLWTCPI